MLLFSTTLLLLVAFGDALPLPDAKYLDLMIDFCEEEPVKASKGLGDILARLSLAPEEGGKWWNACLVAAPDPTSYGLTSLDMDFQMLNAFIGRFGPQAISAAEAEEFLLTVQLRHRSSKKVIHLVKEAFISLTQKLGLKKDEIVPWFERIVMHVNPESNRRLVLQLFSETASYFAMQQSVLMREILLELWNVVLSRINDVSIALAQERDFISSALEFLVSGNDTTLSLVLFDRLLQHLKGSQDSDIVENTLGEFLKHSRANPTTSRVLANAFATRPRNEPLTDPNRAAGQAVHAIMKHIIQGWGGRSCGDMIGYVFEGFVVKPSAIRSRADAAAVIFGETEPIIPKNAVEAIARVVIRGIDVSDTAQLKESFAFLPRSVRLLSSQITTTPEYQISDLARAYLWGMTRNVPYLSIAPRLLAYMFPAFPKARLTRQFGKNLAMSYFHAGSVNGYAEIDHHSKLVVGNLAAKLINEKGEGDFPWDVVSEFYRSALIRKNVSPGATAIAAKQYVEYLGSLLDFDSDPLVNATLPMALPVMSKTRQRNVVNQDIFYPLAYSWFETTVAHLDDKRYLSDIKTSNFSNHVLMDIIVTAHQGVPAGVIIGTFDRLVSPFGIYKRSALDRFAGLMSLEKQPTPKKMLALFSTLLSGRWESSFRNSTTAMVTVVANVIDSFSRLQDKAWSDDTYNRLKASLWGSLVGEAIKVDNLSSSEQFLQMMSHLIKLTEDGKYSQDLQRQMIIESAAVTGIGRSKNAVDACLTLLADQFGNYKELVRIFHLVNLLFPKDDEFLLVAYAAGAVSRAAMLLHGNNIGRNVPTLLFVTLLELRHEQVLNSTENAAKTWSQVTVLYPEGSETSRTTAGSAFVLLCKRFAMRHRLRPSGLSGLFESVVGTVFRPGSPYGTNMISTLLYHLVSTVSKAVLEDPGGMSMLGRSLAVALRIGKRSAEKAEILVQIALYPPDFHLATDPIKAGELYANFVFYSGGFSVEEVHHTWTPLLRYMTNINWYKASVMLEGVVERVKLDGNSQVALVTVMLTEFQPDIEESADLISFMIAKDSSGAVAVPLGNAAVSHYNGQKLNLGASFRATLLKKQMDASFSNSNSDSFLSSLPTSFEALEELQPPEISAQRLNLDEASSVIADWLTQPGHQRGAAPPPPLPQGNIVGVLDDVIIPGSIFEAKLPPIDQDGIFLRNPVGGGGDFPPFGNFPDALGGNRAIA